MDAPFIRPNIDAPRREEITAFVANDRCAPAFSRESADSGEIANEFLKRFPNGMTSADRRSGRSG